MLSGASVGECGVRIGLQRTRQYSMPIIRIVTSDSGTDDFQSSCGSGDMLSGATFGEV